MLCPNAKLTRARRYGRLSPRRCPSAASKCSRAVSGSPWAATSRPLAHAIRAKSDGIARSRRTCSKALYAGGMTIRDIAHGRHRTLARDDFQDHRRRPRRGPGLAVPASGPHLPDPVPGRDRRENPGRTPGEEQGCPHRRGRGSRGRQTRARALDPGHRGGEVLGRRLRRART